MTRLIGSGGTHWLAAYLCATPTENDSDAFVLTLRISAPWYVPAPIGVAGVAPLTVLDVQMPQVAPGGELVGTVRLRGTLDGATPGGVVELTVQGCDGEVCDPPVKISLPLTLSRDRRTPSDYVA